MQGLELTLAESTPENDQMIDMLLQKRFKTIQMIAAFADDDGRTPFGNGREDISYDHLVPTRINRQGSDDFGELRLALVLKSSRAWHERRRSDSHDMAKDGKRFHPFRIDTMPDGATGHLNNRMLSVLPNHCRGEAEEILCGRSPCHALKRRRGDGVTLVHYDQSIGLERHCEEVVLHPREGLYDRDIQSAVGTRLPAPDPADLLGGDFQELRESCHPLGLKLFSIDQHQRGHLALGNHPGRQHGFPESRPRRQHTDLMLNQRIRGQALLLPQFACEMQELLFRALLPLVNNLPRHPRTLQRLKNPVETPARQDEPIVSVHAAVNDSRRIVNTQAQTLHVRIDRIHKRCEPDQPATKGRRQLGLTDVDGIPKRDENLIRQVSPGEDIRAELRIVRHTRRIKERPRLGPRDLFALLGLQDAPFGQRTRPQPPQLLCRDQRQIVQKLPLIRIRDKTLVDKAGIPRTACSPL